MSTTDSYWTQPGELEHRCSKRRFPRTSKKKDQMVASIASQEGIECYIEKVNMARETVKTVAEDKGLGKSQRLRTSPQDHYYIAKSSRVSYDLTAWLAAHGDDPVVENFIPRLKDHLIARLQGLEYDGDEHNFSDADRDSVLIADNKIYGHRILRVNYTTYDLRGEQDTINPRTRADIMVLSHEDERTHPYWYARVLGIFHVNVEYRENETSLFSHQKRMDFLFVRWFRRDNSPAGWAAKRLQRLELFDVDTPADAFGFLDPDSVVRGVHLIPAFAFDVSGEPDEVDPDWHFYYINMFVDRDMFMRFRGGGIGHKATRDWDDILQHEGHGAEDVVRGDNEDADRGGEDLEAEEEAEEGWDGDAVDDNGDDGNGNGNGDDDSSGDDEQDEDGDDDEDEDDHIVADEREVLDDDVLAGEGYTSL
ncbi:hypothetical protein AZE42_07562 [Rhizopogon vesiculosus]|uniref:Uncharacterized protein n=1 Tax=Rhizopogon vesiculosus TaxID=180088 RepID=A0A1J8R078_9AGAM|nr:hypothetical protein AZE42_07562 [Rhizopogon vesiculosus]